MSPFNKKEFIALFVLLAAVTLILSGWRNYRLHNPSAIQSDIPVEIYLHDRTGLDSLVEKMDSLGVNVDSEELRWAGRVLGWRNFRSGLYIVDGSHSYDEFLSNMARGIQNAASVTILSGSDPDRIAVTLGNQLKADADEFSRIFTDSSDMAQELNLSGEELFSRMLPNTYQIYWTASPENAVQRVYNEFDRMIADRYRDEISESPYSLSEIITLASIVEMEAKVADEKPRIAGLYLNRLNRNMLLQADPTVIYALGERRRLLFEDYRFDHPYNTYIYAGLPPGPITNPDEASIRAVLNPEDHDYLFMVAAPDGSHRFSRTFEEHREASAEWRRWIQEQYRLRDERERLESENQE
ncbi:endolytic transglycosylase MltG [Rhodohalobacter sp.]|uniref:endolytic transglycosylase MltG n=1 Tax=Rhodohalobacter sp. TaxID=1974210 RepID=UPI002ACEC1CD|nr:endolytic transglycosylase MltG [Rhodohalobacter sp.]MDZ7757650.1 endolytic transglycosylase MltG [Rhodohalobacter sp.]